jgi:hypothetical protein
MEFTKPVWDGFKKCRRLSVVEQLWTFYGLVWKARDRVKKGFIFDIQIKELFGRHSTVR